MTAIEFVMIVPLIGYLGATLVDWFCTRFIVKSAGGTITTGSFSKDQWPK